MKHKLDIEFKTKHFRFCLYRGYMSGKIYGPYLNRLLTIRIFNKVFYFNAA